MCWARCCCFHREERLLQAPNRSSLAEATARQIGIAINNAELFNLIRDQSEHLGNMLREQQIEASRSRAILEAVADGVVVTDDHGRITLFNISAERILDLKASEVDRPAPRPVQRVVWPLGISLDAHHP